MKRFFFISFFTITILALKTNAQDIIIRTNGSKMLSKVLDYKTDTVKYKSADDLNGPTYILMKTEIKMINLSNGTTLIFNADNDVSQEIVTKTKEKELKKERIFFYGSTYYLNNNAISYRKVCSIINEKGNSQILKTLKSGRLMNGAGNTLLFSGLSSLLMGLTYTALPSEDKIPGVVMILTSIPVMTTGGIINHMGKKNIRKACGDYNNFLRDKNAFNFRIGKVNNGFGMLIDF